MRYPSVKTLTAVFGERAQEARNLIEGKVKTGQYQSVKDWEAQCFNRPSYGERLMCALNEIAGTHGSEAIFGDEGAMQPDYEYLNMGDTYDTTLIRDCNTGRLFVSTMGDVVEKMERKSTSPSW